MSRHEDHATIIDSLDRLPLVEKLADAVMTCRPPRVFGVHGDWGEGKTSFLHQLHYMLDGMPARKDWTKQELVDVAELIRSMNTRNLKRSCVTPSTKYAKSEEVLVVWFEAWRYQHEAAPIVALLHEMRGQLGRLARTRKYFEKLGEVTLRTSLMQLDKLASVVGFPGLNTAGLVETIESQGERWEREHFAEQLPAEALREQFNHAIDQLLGNGMLGESDKRRRVVVLIDDLDRCEPTATFRLLEGIKVYLNIPSCVFVLGMDRRVIVDAIAEVAPGMDDKPEAARLRANEYIEKLFQSVYYLPMVRDVPTQIMAYLPEDLNTLTVPERDSLWALLQSHPRCIPANPRKIKGFASVLWRLYTQLPRSIRQSGLFRPVSGADESAATRREFSLPVIFAALHYFHPEIYRAIEAHGEAMYESLWNWCSTVKQGDQSPEPCLRTIEPAYLSNAVAQSGATKLPPLTRRMVDYSRGEVLRIQELIYHARPVTQTTLDTLLIR
jgi:hypothetical protein